MARLSNIMVFVEQTDGRVADVSLELISKAETLAGRINGRVEAVTLGHGMEKKLAALGAYGCDRIYYVDDAGLASFTSVPYAKAVTEVIETYKPRMVFFGATTTGRDLAPRVASALGCGLTADCTDLRIDDVKIKKTIYEDALLQIRPAFGGNIVATIVSPERVPSMATVREGVMRLKSPDTGRSCKIIPISASLSKEDFPTEILDIIRAKSAVNLKSSRLVVSAGMGAATPEGIRLVKQLARTLGGDVGASRPVIDAGLLPKEHQVGQTGTTVRPNLYIACGISGQIQHRAGMSESMRIMAINQDPAAPIFNIAHYGIVGNVADIIPEIIRAYKTK